MFKRPPKPRPPYKPQFIFLNAKALSKQEKQKIREAWAARYREFITIDPRPLLKL